MAGYGMTGSSAGFGFGGGGFGGIGDFGQALYTGLGNAMPMLTQLYNFQDANALRQDAMNAQSSSLRNQTFANGAEALKNALIQQMWQASIAKQVNPEDYDAMVRGIGKPPVQAAAPITTVESAAGTTGTVSGYVPQTIGGGGLQYQWDKNNPQVQQPTDYLPYVANSIGLNGMNYGFGSNPFGYKFGGLR